jgi:hypothetical protein
LAIFLAHGIQRLIDNGDLQLARQLPAVLEMLTKAHAIHGDNLSARITKRLSIEQILKKYKAQALLAMLSALHPGWDKLHGIHNRKEIVCMSEERLREWLLSKDCRLTPMIVNIVTLKGGETENINYFVEHLYQGRLWGLGRGKTENQPGKTYVDCPWKGQANPPIGNVKAWMELVMPFLEKQCGDGEDPMRLTVLKRLLARRKFVRCDSSGRAVGRLADDESGVIWNQLKNEIEDAWQRMAKRQSKLKLRERA